ncbi:MAG: 30S ribosomal protein S8 [Chloroflexota bacterium]|nr:30S ribosomal protein S8 [Chloroflexota bacterium]
MTITDPIADMLTRIRNALMVGHTRVTMPSSKMRAAIADILKEEGFIEDYHMTDDYPQPDLVIDIKYVGERKERHPVIRELKRVSKPGRRVYRGAADIPWVKSGMGVTIVSTSKGVMTGQKARRLGVGGEVLCYVW